MPKRKIKEEKPRKRLGRKEMLIVPIAMGGATLLALVIIPLFAPPPNPTEVCLKAHNVETFQIFPRIEFFVDGQAVLLPDNVGKHLKDGKECLRPIHTDAVGNDVHIEYIRPIRLSMADFMRIYAYENNSITVINNSTGTNTEQVINLDDYDIQYSYFSEKQEFTKVESAADMPPFTKEMAIRVELTHK